MEIVCLTLATPENIEVVGDAGVPYIDEFDLAEKLQRVLRDGSLVQAYRHRAQQRFKLTTTGIGSSTSTNNSFNE
jgi:hypothetical protein